MGVNNRQRRAAKQRKRAQQRSGRGAPSAATPEFEAVWDDPAIHDLVELHVADAVRRIGKQRLDAAALRRQAEALIARVRPAPWHVVQTAVGDALARQAASVLAGGWGPADLAELVRRSADVSHVPALLTVLYDEARHNPGRRSAWLTALADLGEDPRLRLDSLDELSSGLQVAALLATAPLLDATSLPAGADDAEAHPKLARVRALLAKAESTTYDEEAEALSAKAQELISRYALGRLLDGGRDSAAGSAFVARRIWLDPPYVRAKAALVHAVAGANHAQTALCPRHDFSVVVGVRDDLDAVELLVTSLLVQANRAMLRHGRRHDAWGVSRTRSFRQSFLLAYADRIGQRLQEAAESVTAERFLPVLRDHDAKVGEAFDAMVPHARAKGPSVGDPEGWAAGLAAADLALLDVNGEITDQTG